MPQSLSLVLATVVRLKANKNVVRSQITTRQVPFPPLTFLKLGFNDHTYQQKIKHAKRLFEDAEDTIYQGQFLHVPPLKGELQTDKFSLIDVTYEGDDATISDEN